MTHCLKVTGVAAASLAFVFLLVGRAAAQDPSGDPAPDPQDPPAEEAVAEPPVAPEPLDPESTLGDLLVLLGEARPSHWIEPTPDRIRQGGDIVLSGRTTDDDGRPSKVASPGFLCTDCHTVDREDPDLRVADPDARLDYVMQTGQPFLPGTTLWGVVNRRSWFNDDYIKKYGTLVKPANESLREAVFLCAAECSQGRLLLDWEVDAILAWLWTVQIRLGDLDLPQQDLDFLAAAVTDPAMHEEARARLQAGFLPAAPAHLRTAPADRSAGYGNVGDPVRGEALYRTSCLTCHQADKGDPRGVRGTFPLDDSKASLSMLWRNRASTTNLGFHQVITHGTRPYGVPMAYMPFFTQERMSDQQVDDLMAWFRARLGVQ